VAIVGGGVTGCGARSRARAGKRVRVFEACEIAGGASGRNGGFALRGGAQPYDVARRELGAEVARVYWQLTERYLERLEELAGDAFRRTGSLRLAVDAEERAELESEYEALRDDGFAVEWRDELQAHLAERFDGAISHPGDGSLQPARWVRRLAATAAEAGAELREHERIGALGELQAEQVVLATDGYTTGLVRELDAAIRPTRGQVVATELLGQRLYPCPHYARHGYDYWYQRRPTGGSSRAASATRRSSRSSLRRRRRRRGSRKRWSGSSKSSSTASRRSPTAGPASSGRQPTCCRWSGGSQASTGSGSLPAAPGTATCSASPAAS